jgi:hypothetical protein
VTAVRTAKQFLTYVNGAPFQPAVALGLGLGDDFYAELRGTLRAKRDLLCDGLRSAGFDVFVPQGTYFATVDIRSVGGRRRPRVLPCAPRPLRRRSGAELGLLRGSRHRPAPRAVRLLQAHGGPHRGQPSGSRRSGTEAPMNPDRLGRVWR